MLVSTSGTTTHDPIKQPMPTSGPHAGVPPRTWPARQACVGLPIQTVGVAELLSPKAPFGDTMIRVNPHTDLSRSLPPTGGRLLICIEDASRVLWAREWIRNHSAQHEEYMKQLLASATTYLPQRTRRQP
jgi:hypothetical protein